jgi:acetoin utilization protein AcuB
MSSPAVTIATDTPFQDALNLMHQHRFRRLPVVDHTGRLVGIVSERDLLYASPSKATSLSIWELNYLLAKIRVADIMTVDVISVTPDTLIEEAALLMAENKIGGLPVVNEADRVVGVITETDVFKAFVEMYAAGRSGLRLTLSVPDQRDVLTQLCKAISGLGGNIVSVGSFNGNGSGERGFVVKVQEVSRDQLVDTLEALGDHVIDAREV